jgi:hypothetical protein
MAARATLERMSQRDVKRATERGIFELFARRAELDVVPGSIAQPDPPDILCDIVGLGRVAFELTQVDDAAALTRMALLGRTDELWALTLAGLEPGTLARLRAAHSDSQVALEYIEPSTTGERREAMRAVAMQLAELPAEFEGLVYDWRRRAPSGLRRVEVIRCGIGHGPISFGVSPGGIEAIQLPRIDAKLARDYGADVRIELLAYVRWGDPASLDERDFAGYLAERTGGSHFARVWLFETTFGKVIAHAP